MVGDYKITDICLWTFSFFIALFSLIYSILSYYFSSKSTNLIKDHIERTWIITEANRLFFSNMNELKKANSIAIRFLRSTSEEKSYYKYNLSSLGTRIKFINSEFITIFKTTKYSELIEYYEQQRKNFDKSFLTYVDVKKIMDSSQSIMDQKSISKLIAHHKDVTKWANEIIKKFIELNTQDDKINS